MLTGYTGLSQTIFTQDFEGTWTLPGTLSPAWSGTNASNNSWHQCAYTTGWTSSSGAYAPSGANGTNASARFHTYDTPTGISGDLITPVIDLSAYTAGTIQLDFYHINTTGTDLLTVCVSGDGGSTWSAALAPSPIGVSGVWTLKSIPLPGNSAATKIKFTATSDYGITDIGIDEIKIFIPVPANSPPIGFTATNVTSSAMTIGWTDNSTNETRFRVYRSTDNLTFTQQGTDIASTSTGTTGTAYSQVQSALLPGTTYYYRIAAVYESESPYLSGAQATSSIGNISSVGSGNWSSTIPDAPWPGGVVPGYADNVTISDGSTVNIDTPAATCRDLTVGQGASGILTFTSATASVLTVNGSITVAAGGNFNAGTTASVVHKVYIGGNSATSDYVGNLTVNGTFDMWESATTGMANITFFGSQNSVINGSGMLDFSAANTLNKGATTATLFIIPPILSQ